MSGIFKATDRYNAVLFSRSKACLKNYGTVIHSVLVVMQHIIQHHSLHFQPFGDNDFPAEADQKGLAPDALQFIILCAGDIHPLAFNVSKKGFKGQMICEEAIAVYLLLIAGSTKIGF